MHEKVLIVDDERAIANLTAMWIEQAGFTTLVAHDGRSGLEATAAHHPHVILLDIRMPDLDGIEVNRRLKENPEWADIPVIFLSAHAQESAREEALSSGAADFLSKPCEFSELIGTTRAALERHRQKVAV
jgi:DNA-binding response OmpR family regulator